MCPVLFSYFLIAVFIVIYSVSVLFGFGTRRHVTVDLITSRALTPSVDRKGECAFFPLCNRLEMYNFFETNQGGRLNGKDTRPILIHVGFLEVGGRSELHKEEAEAPSGNQESGSQKFARGAQNICNGLTMTCNSYLTSCCENDKRIKKLSDEPDEGSLDGYMNIKNAEAEASSSKKAAYFESSRSSCQDDKVRELADPNLSSSLSSSTLSGSLGSASSSQAKSQASGTPSAGSDQMMLPREDALSSSESFIYQRMSIFEKMEKKIQGTYIFYFYSNLLSRSHT